MTSLDSMPVTPDGWTEEVFDTPAEAAAFIRGVTYAGDIDVDAKGPFEFEGRHYVHVKVGDFSQEEHWEEAEEAEEAEEPE